MSTLGKYITDQRIERNLSIRRLAELAKISHTEIHRLENGERKNPSPFVLKAIALALDLKFEQLMRVAGYMDGEPYPSKALLILGSIEDLNDHELEEVKDFIDFLRNKHVQKK